MNSELDKLYKLKKSEAFYKLVLIASNGVQNANGANLSQYSFSANYSLLPFKGLCQVEIEQIILDQYTGVPAGGQVFVRLQDSQMYSSASDRNMNSNNIIAIIPINGVNPTTYALEPSFAPSIMSIDENIVLSLTDKNGANIASNTYTDLMVVLRVYPLRNI